MIDVCLKPWKYPVRAAGFSSTSPKVFLNEGFPSKAHLTEAMKESLSEKVQASFLDQTVSTNKSAALGG